MVGVEQKGKGEIEVHKMEVKDINKEEEQKGDERYERLKFNPDQVKTVKQTDLDQYQVKVNQDHQYVIYNPRPNETRYVSNIESSKLEDLPPPPAEFQQQHPDILRSVEQQQQQQQLQPQQLQQQLQPQRFIIPPQLPQKTMNMRYRTNSGNQILLQKPIYQYQTPDTQPLLSHQQQQIQMLEQQQIHYQPVPNAQQLNPVIMQSSFTDSRSSLNKVNNNNNKRVMMNVNNVYQANSMMSLQIEKERKTKSKRWR